MGIFRGEGGSGDATTDAIASQVSIDSASASASATSASNSATASATSATNSNSSYLLALGAKISAQFAASAAATSEANASNYATASANSFSTAAQAKQDALAAKTSAETAETNAETAEDNAVVAKTAAETAETNAATSAGTASTKAGEASISATNASNSATAAASSASSALTSATSAASALTSINAFYLGSAASNPTVDGNGNAVTAGDWYFNTSDNSTRIYTGSTWSSIEDIDSSSVAAAGALMDSEVTNLAQVKAFDSSDYATSTQGTTADNALPKAGGAVTGPITTNSTFDGREVATDGTKLDGIEASADVTDEDNVTSAGALMDSEVTNLAQVKAFDSSDYATSAQGTTADSAMQNLVEDTSPQLGGDLDLNSNNITGTGNITTTGTLQTSSNVIVGGDLTVSGTTTTVNTETINLADNNIVLNSNHTGAPSQNSGITVERGTSADKVFQWNETNDYWEADDNFHVGGNISLSGNVDGRDIATDGTKLDGIEASADVTDATNVTAAGALMDSEVTNLAQVKAFDSSDYATSAQGTTADSALQNVLEDTTPQLGGNLDLNSNNLTGTGNIDVTGTVTADGLTVDASTSAMITLNHSTPSNLTTIGQDSSGDFRVRSDNVNKLKSYANGDFELYEDTGTTAKLFWDAADERLGIGTGSPEEALHVSGSFGDAITSKFENTGSALSYIEFENSAASGALIGARGQRLSFLPNGTETMVIDSSGNVGIGTSSPTDTLSVGTLGSGSNSIITIGASATGTSSIYFGDGASAARFRGYFDYVHSSDSLAIGTAGAERMLIDSSGNVDIGGHVTAGDSSTAAEVIAHYSDGSRTRLQGFGLTFERSSSYVRPSADGTKTLYIGGSDATLDWNQIHFRSLNGLYMTGTRFLTTGRDLQNIASIAVDGNVKLDGNYPVGTDNVALGDTALDSSTGTALRNIAIGSKALTGVTTQDDNIGIGYQACLSSGTNDNIAIGNYALDGTDSGTGRNIAIGHFSMSANLASGCFANTCLGYKTGISISSGNDNTLLGYEAGKSLTTGSDNVAIGKSTLDNINTESFNTAVGAFALGSASASVSSTAVGQSAGVLITTGSKNTLIGRFSGNQDGLDIRTLSNRIVLSDGDGNVGLYIDNSQDAHFDGNVIAYSTTISDRRLKSDITNISNALDKVGQINGVTFVRNQNGEKAAGIVAQEIMEVLPEAVKSQALPLQTGEQDKEYYVVEYDAVTGLLVEAVKELKARVEALESK